LACALAAQAVFAGCADPDPAPAGTGPPVANPQAVANLQHDWTLTSLTVGDQAHHLVTGAPVTLELRATSVRGSTSCNSYASIYGADQGGSFSLGELGTTGAECEEPIRSQEVAYFEALRGATRWTMPDTTSLKLTGPGIVAEFALAAAVPETEPPRDVDFAGRWTLTSLTTPAGPVPLEANHEVWVGFASRLAIGSSGCNAFAASVEPSGARGLVVAGFTAGLKACRPIAAVHAVEAAFQTALVNANLWEMPSGGELVVTGRKYELRFTKTGPAPDLGGAVVL
jgi:heat shock protein HslJ